MDGTDADDVAPRPWSLAAAMEPVPPLAPPPARPGHGVSLVTARQAGEPSRPPSLVVVGVLLAAVALLTVLVLVLVH